MTHVDTFTSRWELPAHEARPASFARSSLDNLRKTAGVALVVCGLLAGALMADTNTYTLKGRITDTDDNWLPDVRVELKGSGVVTTTDPNGLFELTFTSDSPLKADRHGAYGVLELDKEGHLGRSVPITDAARFEEPFVETMQPNPVGEDTVGFSVRLPLFQSLHGLSRSIPDFEAGMAIDTAVFDRLFERKKMHPSAEPRQRVSFHAYVPADVARLRAVFLISRHGMGTLDHPLLRDFADRHGIALVGVLGAPMQRGFLPIENIDPHLERLGAMVGHPELATVPVFTFGHSNGTGFAAIFPSQRPERVIAWISYHSGWSWHLQFPGIEQVPGLIMHGHQDAWLEHGQEATVQHLRRERNAAVGMMLEANVGHGPVDPDATWGFIIAFCEAAMRIRLNEDGTLRPVDITAGWLGALYDRSQGGQQELAIAPYDAYEGNRAIANWLPDERFATRWQAYGRTDPRGAP